jgi:L-ascorbate metabolism protein UlaG (beta-lactamase superfamily)
VRAPDSVTWIGHSTVVTEIDGMRIITDPVLTDRVAHLRRRRPLVVPDHPVLDAVVISHAHMDHLHPRSLSMLSRRAHLVVPRGARALVDRLGFATLTEVVVGDTVQIGDVEVRAVPAMHRPGRGPHSRLRAEAIGFVLSGTESSVYFAGDTDLFDAMADLAGVSVALLPIWGWGSTIGEGHLDPSRAVDAVRLLDAANVVPIHWGTLTPANGRRRVPSWLDQPIAEFARLMEVAGLSDRLRALMPGDSFTIPGPAVTSSHRPT